MTVYLNPVLDSSARNRKKSGNLSYCRSSSGGLSKNHGASHGACVLSVPESNQWLIRTSDDQRLLFWFLFNTSLKHWEQINRN
ncbi:hypothetical protein TNIN_249321 [Trichonephila inaurata madagascariensis]|uniref:Uncharacterized protein n=1 Tax=Trichonephila inaurata madagascariensis TaxID=2747483 RepID=A0A8X6I8Z8_9ARAC|nr:hypothetical protein TNIN_249321 [Trichonephila inaurata madagascariensis]